MKVTIQYFDGCPHWQLADKRVRNVIEGMSNDEVSLEYQLIDTLEKADRVGFLGSPTILVDGVDVMRPEDGAPTGDACRLDLPTPRRVLDALRGHRSSRVQASPHSTE